jgi:hypothetical protein
MPPLACCLLPLLLTVVGPFAASPDLDQGLMILQRLAERLSTEMDVRLSQLQALQAEKFRNLEATIQANEKHATDTNSLQTLAIAKAEATTIEHLKGLNTAVQEVERTLSARQQAMEYTLSDRLQALKERLDRLEGEKSGIGTSWGVIVALIGISVGVIGFVRSLRIPKPP